jgi:hypothetical protein
MASPRLGQLVADISSSRRPGSDPRPVHVKLAPILYTRISLFYHRPCITANRRFIKTRCEDDIRNDIKKLEIKTLFGLQPDAQNSYLFTYNTFIKILYMFLALPCSSSGGLRRNCIYAASGIVTVCRWLTCAPVKKEEFFLNRCTGQSPAGSDNITGCIYTITTKTSWRRTG